MTLNILLISGRKSLIIHTSGSAGKEDSKSQRATVNRIAVKSRNKNHLVPGPATVLTEENYEATLALGGEHNADRLSSLT